MPEAVPETSPRTNGAPMPSTPVNGAPGNNHMTPVDFMDRPVPDALLLAVALVSPFVFMALAVWLF